MPEQLSAIIITLNEEKNIARCLEAVAQVADEIIVVDSFSTDRTEEICLSYGTKFIKHKFEGYIEQKDYARSLASHDFVLNVDADEVLSDELISSIKKVKANPQYNAYTVNRLSYYVDRFIYHGHWFPDKKVRLFRKNCGYWGGRSPHDKFIPNKNEKVRLLHGLVYHYTFRSIDEHMNQASKFSEIGAKELKNTPKFILIIKALLSPFWGFFYGYIFRLGFLDGRHGLTIALISSMETYLKYTKARFVNKHSPNSELSVMHLSSMPRWRGGEQQVVNLVEQLRLNGIYNHLVLQRNSELSRYCENNGIPYNTINYANGFNLFAAWKVKRLSKKLKIDIVHMHCSPSHTLGVFSNILGNKANLVLARRVIFPVKTNLLSIKKYNHPAIKRIICVSKAIKDVMATSIQSDNLLSVVYDGVDIDRITTQKKGSSVRDDYQLSDKIVISIIAALSPEKDHLTFLKAAKILLESGKDFHFLIVGQGKEEENIRTFVKTHNLASGVTMTGFRDDIPNILKESNYFVLTSTQEGLGSSILEAFANKTSVIATAVGGIPEIVIDGETGLLAKSGDAEAIARHILTLEENSSLKQTMIDKAYQMVNHKFKIENTAANTLDIYRDIVVS